MTDSPALWGWILMRYLLLIILLCGISDAKPAPKKDTSPPDAPLKKPPTVPDMAGMLAISNWGEVTQRGRDVFITGHERWEANGRIRDDGSLLLAWVLLATGEVCPGVYRIEGQELRGTWGHAGQVEIEPDGSLSGNTRPDRIYKLATPEPPIN